MAQITISLPDDLEQRLRAYSEHNGYPTLSSLAAEAFREKLVSKPSLDYWTKVGLVLSLENNRKLSSIINSLGIPPIDGKDWDFNSTLEALTDGYKTEYESNFQFIDSEELSEYAARYVINVLAMFDDLQWSANQLKDEDMLKKVAFPGFDGNHETELMGYARYLAKNRRFDHIQRMFEDFNSHGMSLDYRSMLGRYDAVRSRKADRHNPLTKEEIKEILSPD